MNDESKNKLISKQKYYERIMNPHLDYNSFQEINKHDEIFLKKEKLKSHDFFSQRNTVPFLMFNFAKFGSDFISDLKSFYRFRFLEY